MTFIHFEIMSRVTIWLEFVKEFDIWLKKYAFNKVALN